MTIDDGEAKWQSMTTNDSEAKQPITNYQLLLTFKK
jgi:hypothetical protein